MPENPTNVCIWCCFSSPNRKVHWWLMMWIFLWGPLYLFPFVLCFHAFLFMVEATSVPGSCSLYGFWEKRYLWKKRCHLRMRGGGSIQAENELKGTKEVFSGTVLSAFCCARLAWHCSSVSRAYYPSHPLSTTHTRLASSCPFINPYAHATWTTLGHRNLSSENPPCFTLVISPIRKGHGASEHHPSPSHSSPVLLLRFRPLGTTPIISVVGWTGAGTILLKTSDSGLKFEV